MRIDHRGPNIVVAEQLPHGTDVLAVFEEMRDEAVPQRMEVSVIVDSGRVDRPFHWALDDLFREMVSLGLSRTVIGLGGSREKQVLPAPLFRSVGEFPL